MDKLVTIVSYSNDSKHKSTTLYQIKSRIKLTQMHAKRGQFEQKKHKTKLKFEYAKSLR